MDDLTGEGRQYGELGVQEPESWYSGVSCHMALRVQDAGLRIQVQLLYEGVAWCAFGNLARGMVFRQSCAECGRHLSGPRDAAWWRWIAGLVSAQPRRISIKPRAGEVEVGSKSPAVPASAWPVRPYPCRRVGCL